MHNYLNTNSKLKKDNIFKFSLPVKVTCIGAKSCLQYCYATKGAYRTYSKTIAVAHTKNHEFSKSKHFVQDIVTEILRRKIKVVRLHDCGDFYSQAYVEKWLRIAMFLPDVRFYAYTKSLNLDFRMFTSLQNTKIIQSVGGKYDSLIDLNQSHAMIFEKKITLDLNNYVDCSKSDLKALNTKNVKIGLIKH